MLDQADEARRARSARKGPRLDFQDHLADLEAAGLVTRIDTPINKDTELHPLVRWQFVGGVPEDKRRAFVFTNVTDAKGRKYDIPVVVGALSASPEIYAIGMGRKVEEIGEAWLQAINHPIAPVAVTSAPCQEVVITGNDLKAPGGLNALPVPVSTPGFDSAPYLTATLCVTRDPDSGVQNMGTYRAALKAADRLAVRMVAREATGAGGFRHWLKYRDRGDKMPIAIVIGAAPVVVFTGPQKLAIDLDELGVAGGLAGEPIRVVKGEDRRPSCAGRRRDRHRRPDRLPKARARGAVRRKQRLRRARSLQHADAGHRHHPQEEAGVLLDHQPGDAERIERHQEGRLRAAVPRPSARRAGDQGRAPRRHARAADQFAAGDLRADQGRDAAHRGVAGAARRFDADVELRQDRRRGVRRHRSGERRRGAVVARLSLEPDRGRAARALSRRRAGRAIRPRANRFQHADRRHPQAADGAAGTADPRAHGARAGAVGTARPAPAHRDVALARLPSRRLDRRPGRNSPSAPPPATGKCPASRRWRVSAAA